MVVFQYIPNDLDQHNTDENCVKQLKDDMF
jgi:hypothetical protein